MRIRVGAFAMIAGVGTFGRWGYVGAVELECGRHRRHCSAEEGCRRDASRLHDVAAPLREPPVYRRPKDLGLKGPNELFQIRSERLIIKG